jgi:hypothetical protein
MWKLYNSYMQKTKIQGQLQIYWKYYNQYYDKCHCYCIMCLPLCYVLFIVSYTFLMCEKDALWPNYSCPSAPLFRYWRCIAS